MRLSRLVVLVPLSSACVTAYGCSPAPDPSTDISSRLAEDTGVEWAVRTDETNNEVRFLSPEKPVRIGEGTPEQMARAFFDRYRAQLHGTGEPDELRAIEPVVENDGTTHVRFEHYLPGTDIPVLASASTAHFTGQGEVYYLQPGFRADLAHVSSKSAITEADAIERAVERASAACDAPSDNFETRGAELAVRGAERLPALLVWRVPMRAQAGSCTAPEVLVDATTGEVASLEETAQPLWDTNAKGFHFHHRGEKSDVKGIDVTRSGATYSLQSTRFSKVITRSYGTKANGTTPSYKDITTTTLGSWPSTNDVRGTEVDAHYHAMHALEFWEKGLASVGLPARHGLDGRYGNTMLIVHNNSEANDNGMNARCAPSDGRFFKDAYLHFGDGDFRDRGRFLPFAAAYDIVVHETAHAITQHTSKLVYAFESGALNESFSDVMAAAAERMLEGGGDAKNFLIGERMTTDGKGLRNMADPPSRGMDKHSVDDMLPCAVPSGEEKGGNDFCHVHSNSGIPNRAFSLMVAGGKHRKSKVPVANGIGWAAATKLWYQTLTNLSSQATFRDAAMAQIAESARSNPQHLQAVACAWHAVGVVKPLGSGFHPALRNVACPEKPTTCDGVADGYLCNSQAPYAGMRCKDGKMMHPMLCQLSLGKFNCRHPTDSWAATVDANNQLVCD